MRQIVEFSWVSLNKAGEELCGDSVMIRARPDTFVAVLSDGLGSGVKAHILSTLTAEIAARMSESGASIEDVVQTLAETLPECSVRKLAYATFAVLTVSQGKDAHLVEFDSAPLILIRGGSIVNLPMEERVVGDRKIREVHFDLEENDFMVLISDGYEHAGLGGIYRLGWGWKNIAMAVQRFVQAGIVDTFKLTQALSNTCLKLYEDKPGDDATVIGMKVRPAMAATVLTGPPREQGPGRIRREAAHGSERGKDHLRRQHGPDGGPGAEGRARGGLGAPGQTEEGRSFQTEEGLSADGAAQGRGPGHRGHPHPGTGGGDPEGLQDHLRPSQGRRRLHPAGPFPAHGRRHTFHRGHGHQPEPGGRHHPGRAHAHGLHQGTGAGPHGTREVRGSGKGVRRASGISQFERHRVAPPAETGFRFPLPERK